MNRQARAIMFRDGVNPLRCAFPASRKPGAYIRVRPFDVYVSPMEPSGKASLLCTPRHMTTRAHWSAECANFATFLTSAPMPLPA